MRKFKKTKNTKSKKIWDSYPAELRGPSQNKFGGHETSRLRCYQNNTFGPASECKTYSKAAKAAWAAEHGFPCSGN